MKNDTKGLIVGIAKNSIISAVSVISYIKLDNYVMKKRWDHAEMTIGITKSNKYLFGIEAMDKDNKSLGRSICGAYSFDNTIDIIRTIAYDIADHTGETIEIIAKPGE